MNTKINKAHTMIDILTQLLDDSPAIEDEVEFFFKKLNVPETLENWGCTKRSGKPADEVLQDILNVRLARVSVENNAEIDKVPVDISKDQYYRFLQRQDTDWIRINSELAIKTIEHFDPNYTSNPEAEGIFIVDDTPFKRPYSKKTEMLSYQFDHADQSYFIGGRLSVLGYYYGGKYLPINSALVTSTKEEKYYAPPHPVKAGSPAEERRKMAAGKMTEVPFKQIQIAKEAGIRGSHVAFDSWFSSPKILLSLKKDGLDAIARLKTGADTQYWYEGKKRTLEEIYSMNRFTLPPEGDDERLFTVYVKIERDGELLPLKIVFCESYGDSNLPFVAIASTDIFLSDKTIVLLYRLRWKEEVIHKEIKSPELNLEGNQCMNIDSICAHIGIVLILWLLCFFFAEVNRQGDSIVQSFLRVGVHADNIRFLRALVDVLTRLIESLQSDTSICREDLIGLVAKTVVESPSFNFYLENLPLYVLQSSQKVTIKYS